MKISVIVPIYNTEQYLPRCLDSIISQSFSDFELLLIDDGSTDGSGAICDAYAEKDSRVRVFHKENGGVSSARNMGLDCAEGEWIAFVDSDDEFMKTGLQVLVDGISDEADMVMGGCKVYDVDGNESYSTRNHASVLLPNVQFAIKLYKPSDNVYQGYIWSKLFRLSVIRSKSIRYSEDIFFKEDLLFIMQFICSSGKSVVYTSIPVYSYFEREGSAMMSLRKGFNPKFITDLEASSRMNEMVNSSYEDEELLELSNHDVYNSYRRIIGLMKDFRVRDHATKSRLQLKLVSVIGLGKCLRYEAQRDKRRLLNKLKKII